MGQKLSNLAQQNIRKATSSPMLTLFISKFFNIQWIEIFTSETNVLSNSLTYLRFSEKVHGRQNILQIHSLGSTGRQKEQHNRTTVAFPNPFFSFTALRAVKQNSKIPNPFLSLHSYLGYQKEQQKSNKTNSQMSYSKSIPLASQLFRLLGGTAKINQNRYLVAWLAQPILIPNYYRNILS